MAPKSKKWIGYGAGLFVLICVFTVFVPKKYMCRLGYGPITISTVDHGLFVETIPQNGTISDTSKGHVNIRVQIDELYVARISTGLKATTYINNKEYSLVITKVYQPIVEGRFEVDMKFSDKLPEKLSYKQELRMRIELSESSQKMLLPVGGFYKDTDGQWVFVVENKQRAVKRAVKLGRKNPEYFEVLEGLKPGDRVVTSSYEEFKDEQWIDLTQGNKRPRDIEL